MYVYMQHLATAQRITSTYILESWYKFDEYIEYGWIWLNQIMYGTTATIQPEDSCHGDVKHNNYHEEIVDKCATSHGNLCDYSRSSDNKVQYDSKCAHVAPKLISYVNDCMVC